MSLIVNFCRFYLKEVTQKVLGCRLIRAVAKHFSGKAVLGNYPNLPILKLKPRLLTRVNAYPGFSYYAYTSQQRSREEEE